MCDDFAARDSGPCRVMGKPHWDRTKMPNAPMFIVVFFISQGQGQVFNHNPVHWRLTWVLQRLQETNAVPCLCTDLHAGYSRTRTLSTPPTSRTSFGHEMRADNLNSRFHFLKARLTLLIKYSLLSIPCTCRAQRGSTIMPFYYFTHSSLLQWRDAPSRALSQDGRSTG